LGSSGTGTYLSPTPPEPQRQRERRDVGYGYNPADEIASNTRSNDAYSFTLANANVASTPNGLSQLTAHGGATITQDARGSVRAAAAAFPARCACDQLPRFGRRANTFWPHAPPM